jgi:hypothetical protein
MVEQTGGEVAGPVVCEPHPDGGGWYCEVPLRGGRTWEGRVGPGTVIWDADDGSIEGRRDTMMITIQAVDAVLRRGEPDGWEVQFAFTVALDDGSHELWNTGGEWTRLGVPPADAPDALALTSTLEAALSDIVGDVVRRDDVVREPVAPEVRWTGADYEALEVLRRLSLP